MITMASTAASSSPCRSGDAQGFGEGEAIDDTIMHKGRGAHSTYLCRRHKQTPEYLSAPFVARLWSLDKAGDLFHGQTHLDIGRCRPGTGGSLSAHQGRWAGARIWCDD
jgi:hypothetical protein